MVFSTGHPEDKRMARVFASTFNSSAQTTRGIVLFAHESNLLVRLFLAGVFQSGKGYRGIRGTSMLQIIPSCTVSFPA
jgi:hypothetical protein